MCLKINDRKYEDDKKNYTINHNSVSSVIQRNAVGRTVKEKRAQTYREPLLCKLPTNVFVTVSAVRLCTVCMP